MVVNNVYKFSVCKFTERAGLMGAALYYFVVNGTKYNED
jgi:hypothetical protein